MLKIKRKIENNFLYNNIRLNKIYNLLILVKY